MFPGVVEDDTGLQVAPGRQEFLALWKAWRKATRGQRVNIDKHEAFSKRWAGALKLRRHDTTCPAIGRCGCPLEVSGPAELLARGLEYLQINSAEPQFVAGIGAWLNADPPGDRGPRFTRAALDSLQALKDEKRRRAATARADASEYVNTGARTNPDAERTRERFRRHREEQAKGRNA